MSDENRDVVSIVIFQTGKPILEPLDQKELGERFLESVILDEIDRG